MPSFIGTGANEIITPTSVSATVTKTGAATPDVANDLLNGGDGADTLNGGAGADTI